MCLTPEVRVDLVIVHVPGGETASCCCLHWTGLMAPHRRALFLRRLKEALPRVFRFHGELFDIVTHRDRKRARLLDRFLLLGDFEAGFDCVYSAEETLGFQ